MKVKISFFVILSLAVVTLAQDDTTTTAAPSTSPTTSTEAPTSPSTSTEAPSSTTTSTEAPTSPTTSTEAPTSPSTSTEAPSSTTTSTEAPTSPTTSTEAPSSTTTSTEAPSSTTTSTEAPSSTTTSTEAPSSTTTSTEAPSSTTTSTEAPSSTTTSTEAPSSTTTSTETPTSSTTPTPETTTTHLPTTTLPPVTPDPRPFPDNIGTWSYTETGLKSPCAMLKGALQLNVEIVNKSGHVVNVPSGDSANVHVSGKCNSSEEQTLRINWWSRLNTTTERNNTLVIIFAKTADEQYALSLIKYYYEHDKHINITGPFLSTHLQRSFQCKSKQKLKNDLEPSFMLTQDLQFEAFRKEDVEGTPAFSSADVCKADNRTSTGVVLGVAVGIGLLIVLVISLGIYLFKRYRRGGYQPLGSFT